MRSPGQYVDSKTWLSDAVSIGQWNIFRGRTHKRAYETLTGCSSPLHDISSTEVWLSGKAELTVSIDAEGILFQVHVRLGQIHSAGDGSL